VTGGLQRREIAKVVALTNPASGRGAAIRAAQLAIARLHQRGVEVVEIIGDDAHDARNLVAAAIEQGADAVMATGGDGVISKKEIANSTKALKKLDKNADGQLTEDELRPNFGEGQRPQPFE
jgi:molybdopterin biosynthesis enzyme MoaB